MILLLIIAEDYRKIVKKLTPPVNGKKAGTRFSTTSESIAYLRGVLFNKKTICKPVNQCKRFVYVVNLARFALEICLTMCMKSMFVKL